MDDAIHEREAGDSDQRNLALAESLELAADAPYMSIRTPSQAFRSKVRATTCSRLSARML